MTRSLFSLRGIGFAYAGGRRVLEDLDFDLAAGERVVVVGANGSGKTTLLHLMVGLHAPTAGTITAFGAERRRDEEFRDVRARAGLLFQDPDDQLFCPTVLEDVAFGPLNLGRSRRQATQIGERTLAALGLDGLAGRITHKLSGGEKRLVSLAAVLAMQPEALLLDEPTNGLDAEAHARLLDVLRSLPQAMVLVSHDERLIAGLAARAVVLSDGRLHDAAVHVHPHAHRHSHPHVHLTGADADHDRNAVHDLAPNHAADGPEPRELGWTHGIKENKATRG